MSTYNDWIVPGAIAILATMFNFYSVNIVTGYDKRPKYPSYPSIKSRIFYGPGVPMSEEAMAEKQEDEAAMDIYNKEYARVSAIIDELSFKRHLGLLIMGILNIVLSIVINNVYIKNGFGVSGLLTLIFATGSYWTKYTDKARLAIVTVGLVIIMFLAMRMFGYYQTGESFNVFDIKFIVGK